MNILSDDVEFFHGIVSGINVPFTSDTIFGATAEESTRTWIFRRQARYMHYKVRIVDGESADFGVWVNGNVEFFDATNRTGYTWSGYIDLTTITDVPAVNDFYDVYAHIEWAGAGNELTVDYFLESDSTTL